MNRTSIDEDAAELLLGHGFMTLKTVQTVMPDLTYRKLNIWDTENIITFDRVDVGQGWRKFGCNDTVILKITSELRNFGLGIQEIKKIIDSIKPVIDKRIIDRLDFLNVDEVFLVITATPKGEFHTKAKIMDTCLSPDDSPAPILILPFSHYVDQVFNIIRASFTYDTVDLPLINDDKNPSIVKTITSITEKISAKEKKILELIRKNDYHTVTIRKKDGGYIVAAQSTKKGSLTNADILKAVTAGGYRNVTLTTQQGKNISLIDEETFKV